MMNNSFLPARQTIMFVLALALSSTVVAKPKYVASPAPEAQAVLLFDQKTNTIKEAINIHKRLPIASISKLMTAYVVLESNANLSEKITIVPQAVQGSRSLSPGMVVTRRELLSMALIASDNLAAKMLADLHPRGYVEFMKEMNRTAKRLGMVNTGFGDPSGLSVFNTSTVWDLHLLNTALTKYSVFNDAAMQKTSTQYAYGKHGQLQQIVIRNTNALAGEYDIKVGKTGFTNLAGWCISLLIKHKGQEFDLIVLGAPTKKLRNDLVVSKLKDHIVISDAAIDRLE